MSRDPCLSVGRSNNGTGLVLPGRVSSLRKVRELGIPVTRTWEMEIEIFVSSAKVNINTRDVFLSIHRITLRGIQSSLASSFLLMSFKVLWHED
jgi:hypothetical protein